ncbi:HeH/LEM domain protein [compost metagenome]
MLINEDDFDENVHKRFDEGAKKADKAPGIAELRAALTEKGIDFPADAKKADLQALLDASIEG